MKTVIQRVKSASVTVDGQLISTIGKGLLVFAAIAKDDTAKEAEAMASKILKVKFWDGDDGKTWKKNVQDIDGDVLCVSQFTLLASTKKGNKPDFHKAAPPAVGKELYDVFFNQVRELYREDKVKDGVFQAMMDVALVNDGPVGDSDFQGDGPAAFPLPPIALDYRSEDEVVTIEIESNPPELKNPTNMGPLKEGDAIKTNLQKTFELPAAASLLE
ncbi:hypothetical protein DOTSEDRAFT_22359 [Dothistroma septosporum NZE10]|uniref:D-aminoacyl-tRNA deacylase n=1 Tax=Dothistroma septosporum (strain NZE10 / CBS 128990) TaxID=675120 RepID=N1PS28_DOTSN|nr:hypothetical protein DOTSEDRAFT_22359 [Dothistroma septosporum NZE10]